MERMVGGEIEWRERTNKPRAEANRTEIIGRRDDDDDDDDNDKDDGRVVCPLGGPSRNTCKGAKLCVPPPLPK